MTPTTTTEHQPLRLVYLGIDTHQEPIIYMRRDCPVCRAEGFEAQNRLHLQLNNKRIIATLNVVDGDLLAPGQVGLSAIAWRLLNASAGQTPVIGHARPLDSLSRVRAKIYGQTLDEATWQWIIEDIVAGRYADVHLAFFITACAGNRLNLQEIIGLTRAMVAVGECLSWPGERIMDKHCVGGLPGNRTTPIVVAIVTACGLLMPKTSSRAITSPAGSADTLETLMPVNLDIEAIHRVVGNEGGCLCWGGAVSLSPADDILIRVERALDLDSEGQLIASILSKKIAVGATHVLLDIPIGPTAKVRSYHEGLRLKELIASTGQALGVTVQTRFTDGSQPVGRGVGPALEARDVLAVLQNSDEAPADLREHALLLAAQLLEMGGKAVAEESFNLAARTLSSGTAWSKFVAIATAQGGLRTPPSARYQHDLLAESSGSLTGVNNRLLAQVARLAGAPEAPAAGLYVHCRLNDHIEKGQPVLTLHAESPGELQYALDFIKEHSALFTIEPK